MTPKVVLLVLPLSLMMLVLGACGSSPITESSTPSLKPVPSAMAGNISSQKLTNAPRIVNPTVAPYETKTGHSGELLISCTLNRSERKVKCDSNWGNQSSSRNWTSNGTSRTSSGLNFEFTLEEEVDVIEVEFRACLNNSCQTATSVISYSEGRDRADELNKGTNNLQGRNMFELPFEDFPFDCMEKGTTQFVSTFFPVNLILAIEPMGNMAAMGGKGHVTPTDHLYVHRKFSAGNDNVLAPADGHLVKVSRFPEDIPLNDSDDKGNPLAGDLGPLVPDYRVVIMHSCTFFTVFIHLGELAPNIAESIGEIKLGSLWQAGREHAPVLVKAGEPIAKFGSQSFDWSVHDADTILDGFIVPEHYDSESFKIHTVDPFQYYLDPIRTELLSKMVRLVEPRAGKIDYDVEGKIVGNWFLDGTIDYAGSGQPGSGYQKGHLSIAYGSVDPTQLRVSIGADTGIDDSLCDECEGTYGVRDNQPDPGTIDVNSGLVKYELMSRNEESRFVKEAVGNISLGTFLVQHLGNRTIRVEVIPGKSPDEVSGFSSDAHTYRR